MDELRHRNLAELEAGLDEIRSAPRDRGVLDLIVRRPTIEEREVLTVGELSATHGLVGDCWGTRHSSPSLDAQLTLMGSRTIALIAQTKDRWPLAGDQLFVDLDLSDANLPPGARLEIGSAVVEVTAEPHTACRKFSARFGKDSVRFTNSPLGLKLHLRGICAKVIREGTIRAGDQVRKAV